MADYGVERLQDIEEMHDGRCPYRPVRHHFGISTFGATTWTARDVGDRLINEHDEAGGLDELYLVLSGTAQFTLAGETVPAPSGTFVHVPPGVLRTAVADEPGTTLLAIGGGREGKPYRAGSWEVLGPLWPLVEAGRHEELLTRALPLLAANPDYPELLYNVACSEALLGFSDDALDHLRRAITLEPGMVRFLADDADFDTLRTDPGFVALEAASSTDGERVSPGPAADGPRPGVTHLEDIPEQDDGRCRYRAVRHHFGITTFGVTTWTARNAGDRLLNEHDEQDEFDELYLVLTGTARFEIAGESVPAAALTFVRVPPGIMRTAFADEAGTTIVALSGAREGEPYVPGGWEVFAPLRPLIEAGRHEELLARVQPILDAGPDYPELLYNVACSESLLGRTGDALAHLRRAIEMVPEITAYAREDADFAALRDDPAFTELIS